MQLHKALRGAGEAPPSWSRMEEDASRAKGSKPCCLDEQPSTAHMSDHRNPKKVRGQPKTCMRPSQGPGREGGKEAAEAALQELAGTQICLWPALFLPESFQDRL